MPKRLWQWIVGIAACGVVLALARDRVGQVFLALVVSGLTCAGSIRLIAAAVGRIQDRNSAWANLLLVLLLPASIVVGTLLMVTVLLAVALIVMWREAGA